MTTTSSRSKKKRPKSRSGRRRRKGGGGLFIWLFVGVIVVLFGVLAFASRSDLGNVEITNAQVSGEALPAYQDGATLPDGTTAPEISGTSLEGEDVTITPGDGTPKAIAFLAHWCPHCQREMPTVVDWVDDGNLPDDVELVGVATGIDKTQANYPPQNWFENEGWPGITVVDGDNSAAKAYGLSNYPYWVLVDGEGSVVQRWSGETTSEQLTERIGALSGG